MTGPGRRIPWRAYAVHAARTLPVRVLAVALLVAAYRPWAGGHDSTGLFLFCGALVVGVWAAPGLDVRPTLHSIRWAYLIARHRTSALACGAVLIAALGDPPVWQAACTAVLLVGYLAASDAWSTGLTAARPARRTWGEALAAAAASAAVLGAAALDTPESGAGRPLAALVLAAGGTLLVLTVRGRSRSPRPPTGAP
ncbi:hypothetical protein [Streptomyces sp. VRA16 Mangrove soil]|uniref:hypothetical protein n=1 Tax=Streptomyces sp. VRA16 Mangrove soil TaxID=2817434 RepID=UPI001A9E9DE4|nr:hypothetical protein [Streptomyces sp. VRA16 Mangrove soil]MBO1329645.1 hypothetical protein [Streptomyces sp. VRA16 Mangrove soil]